MKKFLYPICRICKNKDNNMCFYEGNRCWNWSKEEVLMFEDINEVDLKEEKETEDDGRID